MLNLSDKELDRLAREAADKYDPGNPSGPESWDRMSLRLDKEIGNVRPNLLRSIRRMPFYYAPAILLLAGVSYFLLRPGRTHPRAAPPAAPMTPLASTTTPERQASATAMNENSGSPPAAGTGAVRPLQATGDNPIKDQNNTYSPTSTPYKNSNDGSKTLTLPSAVPATSTSRPTSTHTRYGKSASSGHAVSSGQPASSEHTLSSGQTASRDSSLRSSHSIGTQSRNHNNGLPGNAAPLPGNTAPLNTTSLPIAPAGPSWSAVHAAGLNRLPQPIIDDSSLRQRSATTVAKAAEPIYPGKKPGPSLHIERPLQLGFSVAPDFASVNSLAGDRPGSSIGLTADYQLINRLHLHTGFLFTHKNYTAAQHDYHVPYNYYRMYNMHDVSFVKGTLNLYEIPLALRYDFSVAGNTAFFISGGLSSYLLTHENCDYYFDLFGRSVYQEFKYGNHNVSLFGTVDLSMGVETGLSNSLSFLIAPYMKLPTTGLGFGRIEMNSVGIDFALKYSPVLRRRRH